MRTPLTANAFAVTASLAVLACSRTPAPDSAAVASASVASARWDKGASSVSDGVPASSAGEISSERPQ